MSDPGDEQLSAALASFAELPDLTPESLAELQRLTEPVECIPKALSDEPPAPKPPEQVDDDLRTFISKATIPQKIKLALFGNATCRLLLIRDTNKMIQQFVLKNPRLQPAEVEDFAKNPNTAELVLRIISNNAQWMRSYALKAIIVSNPKTPPDVGLKWIKFLNLPELRRLAKSKNVSHVVALAARKRVAEIGNR